MLKTRRPCWPCLLHQPPSSHPHLSRSYPLTTRSAPIPMCMCVPGHLLFPTPLCPRHANLSARQRHDNHDEEEANDQRHLPHPPPRHCRLFPERLASLPPLASLTIADQRLSPSVLPISCTPSLSHTANIAPQNQVVCISIGLVCSFWC